MTKVVVVDDDLTNVQLTTMLLEFEGFDVAACTNLTEATSASNPDVDAYIVDINLTRGESGLDLLDAIRKGETAAAPDTIVIITSGDHRRVSDAEEAGANKFLLKPYPPETLSTLIHQLLERQ